MQGFVKRGALWILALIASPFIIALSRNGLLVFQTWWLIAYLVCSKTFPADKQRSVGAIAVQCAQLAWFAWLVFYPEQKTLLSLVHGGVLLVGVVWLFVSQSRAAAAALAAFQLYLLALAAIRLPHILPMYQAGEFSWEMAIPLVLNSFLSKIIAAVLLARFLVKPKSWRDDPGEIDPASVDPARGKAPVLEA